jgi:uncharacterized protein with HEPN domain
MDPDFRDCNPEIEWKRIRGFRNRIVHDYFGIDYEIVWNIIESYLDELIDLLDTIIEKKCRVGNLLFFTLLYHWIH